MAVNDIYRVEVYMNIGSELTMNVFHMRETVSITSPERGQEAIGNLVAALYELWSEFMSELWRVTTIRVRRVNPEGGIPQTLVFGGAEAIVGQLEDELTPPQAAILCSLYSNSPSRQGRGRQYLPGCGESIQNEGKLGEVAYNAGHGAIEDWYEDEHGPVGAGTGKWRVNIWAPGAAVSDTHDVEVAFIHPNLATQRRRRSFAGFAD